MDACRQMTFCFLYFCLCRAKPSPQRKSDCHEHIQLRLSKKSLYLQLFCDGCFLIFLLQVGISLGGCLTAMLYATGYKEEDMYKGPHGKPRTRTFILRLACVWLASAGIFLARPTNDSSACHICLPPSTIHKTTS